MKPREQVTSARQESERGHSIGERLLLLMSRKPGTEDYEEGTEKWIPDEALSQLRRAFPDFLERIAGKDVLDFGCGLGHQVVILAKNGARCVTGIDINDKRLAQARHLAQEAGVAAQVEFATHLEERFKRKFDVVISQNSMEHYPDPVAILEEMKSALKSGGNILVTFGPPWFAPYGSHMHFFTRVPWANILFSEKTVMKVRAHFRSDGATRYEDVESGLNKMSVGKFERVVAESGLRIDQRKYECIKGLDFLANVPVAREFFINNISCALKS